MRRNSLRLLLGLQLHIVRLHRHVHMPGQSHQTCTNLCLSADKGDYTYYVRKHNPLIIFDSVSNVTERALRIRNCTYQHTCGMAGWLTSCSQRFREGLECECYPTMEFHYSQSCERRELVHLLTSEGSSLAFGT